jgi:endo-1,4-beta-xylanase
MNLRFHAFVWHQQSSFMANGHSNGVAQPTNANGFNRTTAFQEMREHIEAVMGRYKTRNGGQMHVIDEWDVVNEAAARDSGNDDPTNLYGGMRRSTGNDSILSRWVGYTQGETNDFDYIDSAFAIAHRNDTTARLVYNDYDAEGTGKKSNTVYSLLSKLKSRNIPVHVLGMQCHWYTGASNTGSSGDWNPQQTVQNMARIAALGLDISITELDIRYQNPTSPTDSTAKLAQQSDAYEEILSICLAQPRCKKFYVWGMRDGSSWINSRYPGYGSPLLFTGSGTTYTPKPAHAGLISVLQTTPVSLRTGSQFPGARRRAPALQFRSDVPVRDLLGRSLPSLPNGRSTFAAQKPVLETKKSR